MGVTDVEEAERKAEEEKKLLKAQARCVSLCCAVLCFLYRCVLLCYVPTPTRPYPPLPTPTHAPTGSP